MKRDFRKPLIVLTPKSLLRHPRCVSPLDDLVNGGFKEIIDDATAELNQINNLVFCSGKIYYELLSEKEKTNRNDIAIIRIEQLYPFPQEQFQELISKYHGAKVYHWVQEEPENMGAWSSLLRTAKGVNFKLISRPESASPATGSNHAHEREQRELIERVFVK